MDVEVMDPAGNEVEKPEPPKKVYRTELDPICFLRRSSYIFPEKTAVVHGNRRYTYREFEERVNRFASHLRADGLQKHDRVAVLCPNIPALLEAHYAVPLAGGILVPINTRLSSPEVGYILQHSGSRVLVVDTSLVSLVEPLDTSNITVVRVDDTGEQDDPYEQYLAQGSPEPVASLLEDEEETISINYTSGTTGTPKGVMYTYRGAYLNSLGEVIETQLNSDSVYLWTLPMFHCDGWCFTWAVTAVAATHVCLRKVDPKEIWDIFDTEGVTHYNGAPTVQISLVNHEKAHPLDRRIVATIAGAPPSPTVIGQLQKLNIHPVHVYGMTETYGPISVCEWHRDWYDLSPEKQSELLSRQGQCFVTADLVRVVDEHMNDVPHDAETQGEIVFHGNNVMKGYFQDPGTTAEAFRGGWLHSGDLGVWHPDGYIELRDRKKDIIVSGGENISTIEVEQTIDKHPAVVESAVIGIPDEKWGERPKAFVALKPGQTVTQEEIIDFCRQHLARFKCPVSVDFGDLPKTSTGKIQKFVLREKEWAGQKKRIH